MAAKCKFCFDLTASLPSSFFGKYFCFPMIYVLFRERKYFFGYAEILKVAE